jgi:hypothetical protein
MMGPLAALAPLQLQVWLEIMHPARVTMAGATTETDGRLQSMSGHGCAARCRPCSGWSRELPGAQSAPLACQPLCFAARLAVPAPTCCGSQQQLWQRLLHCEPVVALLLGLVHLMFSWGHGGHDKGWVQHTKTS